MDNCIFCMIAKGDIPSYKIYEDEEVLAFLDIAKDALGHTVVIPKTHAANLVEADEKTYCTLMKTVKKISKHYVDDCGFDGVNILSNCNAAAGQSVMHLHYHIIPRKENDGIKLDVANANSVNEELADTCAKLKI